MRLIDADAMMKHLENLFCDNCDTPRKIGWCDVCDYKYFMDEMKKEPTVDAVEVVRCKDCKWYKESNHSELYPMRFCYRLKNDDGVPVGYNWADNDFCSYGERRDKKTASYYGDNKLIETVVIDEREKR